MLNVPAPVPSPAPAGFAEIFDAAAAAAELARLPKLHAGHERELRTAVAQTLKAALTRGRAEVERMLLRDRRGRLCAERLCFMQDEIIRILFEFAQKHRYPELASLGFFLRRSEVERQLSRLDGLRRPYGVVFHVPPANVDTVFVYSW